jgi:hypothetical protein
MPDQQEMPSISEAVATGQILVQAVSADGRVPVVVQAPREQVEDQARHCAGLWRSDDAEDREELVLAAGSVRDALATAFANGMENLTEEAWQNLCDDIVIALVLKLATGLDFETGPEAPLSRLRVVIAEESGDADIIARGGLDPALSEDLGRDFGDPTDPGH